VECVLLIFGIILHTLNWKTLWQQGSNEEKATMKNRIIIAGILFPVSFIMLFMPVDFEKLFNVAALLLLFLAIYMCPVVLQSKYIMGKYGDESRKSLKHLKIKLNTNQGGKK
jgi:cell division protein FtsW (lipid II flippase)